MKFSDIVLDLLENTLKSKNCELKWITNEDKSDWVIILQSGNKVDLSLLIELTIVHNMTFWQAFEQIESIDKNEMEVETK